MGVETDSLVVEAGQWNMKGEALLVEEAEIVDVTVTMIDGTDQAQPTWGRTIGITMVTRDEGEMTKGSIMKGKVYQCPLQRGIHVIYREV